MGNTENPSFKSTPPSENSPRELGITALSEENICREYPGVRPLIPGSGLIAIQSLRSKILLNVRQLNFWSHMSRSEFIIYAPYKSRSSWLTNQSLGWMSEPSECLPLAITSRGIFLWLWSGLLLSTIDNMLLI